MILARTNLCRSGEEEEGLGGREERGDDASICSPCPTRRLSSHRQKTHAVEISRKRRKPLHPLFALRRRRTAILECAILATILFSSEQMVGQSHRSNRALSCSPVTCPPLSSFIHRQNCFIFRSFARVCHLRIL